MSHRFTRFTGAALAITLSSLGLTALVAPPAHAASIRAVCSNNAETDAATLNAAIQSSQPGDEVVFDGPCLVDETIVLLGQRTYRGESRAGTTINQARGANLEAIFASDAWMYNTPNTGTPITLKSLTINANSAQENPDTTAIVIRSWMTTVSDIAIWDAGKDGIKLTSVSQDGTVVSNTSVNGTVSGNMVSRSGRYGFYVEDPKNVFTDWGLTDNYIAGSGKDGIHLENAAGWWVRGNHVYGVKENAIFAHRAFGTSFQDNYIEGFGETETAGTYYGIVLTVQGGATSTIANNRVNHFGSGKPNAASELRYIGVTQVNDEGKTGVLTVSGNSFRAPVDFAPHTTAFFYSTKAVADTTLKVASSGNILQAIDTQTVKEGKVKITKGV